MVSVHPAGLRACVELTLVSLHLDTLFLPVCVVGLSVTPVGVGHRGPVRPPVQFKELH